MLVETRVTMEAMRTLERMRRPVGLGVLVLAVVVGGCGPRQAALSPSGDGGGSVGGSRGGGGSGGVVSTTGSGTGTSTSTTTTTTTTSTTAVDTGTGDTGTSGGVVNYYGPCPSGLDEECPQNWDGGQYGVPGGLSTRCLRPVENGVVYSVCEPEAFVESPQNGGGIFCPEVVDESWMGIVAWDDLPQGESFCRILCLKPDDTCPSGMVCRNGARCYWKHE